MFKKIILIILLIPLLGSYEFDRGEIIRQNLPRPVICKPTPTPTIAPSTSTPSPTESPVNGIYTQEYMRNFM